MVDTDYRLLLLLLLQTTESCHPIVPGGESARDKNHVICQLIRRKAHSEFVDVDREMGCNGQLK